MQDIIKKADVLIEALPYIHEFRKKIFVIKYGGSILGDEKIRKSVLEDIVFLSFVGIKPVLVHGGGPSITEAMKQIGKPAQFHDGIRVTDAETLKVVAEELVKLNHLIVKEIKALKGDAGSLNASGEVIRAKKKELKGKVDLGFVGEISAINKPKIMERLKGVHIPVVCPMAKDAKRQLYNVNADEAASAIAVALGAEKFVLLTNVKGVMRNIEDHESFISSLNIKEAKSLIKEQVIQEGMIPKLKACLHTVEGGVKKTHIIDAKVPHALLLEIFTNEGIGTEITP
ncbi:MAG TPA: acetylglutamate kinase [Candidatus Omnitrophota bacterium]|nr:acetylglutamate kinase [Candidatus Omnitrophota bacterium]